MESRGIVQESGSALRHAPRNRAIAYFLSGCVGAYALVVSIGGMILQLGDPHWIALQTAQRNPIHQMTLFHGAAAAVFLIAAAIIRRRGASRFAAKLVIACLPMLILLSVDRVLNVFWPPPIPYEFGTDVNSQHKLREFTLTNNSRMTDEDPEIYVDRYGMRVTRADWHRRLADEPRILFLGDSVTFGYQLPAEFGYVECVQALLNARSNPPKFKALNGGTISHTPQQELDWLQHEGAELAPNLVVVQVCMNDITYALHPAIQSGLARNAAFESASRKPHWSAIIRLAQGWGRSRTYGDDLDVAAEFIETENFALLFDESSSDAIQKAWNHAFDEWEQMLAFCHERRMPIAFVVIPFDDQIEDREMSDSPQARICSFAAAHRAPCLDLLPMFRLLRHNDGLPVKDLYLDYTHPSATGHAVIAESIVRFLDTNGLLDGAATHCLESNAVRR